MVDVLEDAELASYLSVPVTEGLTLIVEKTNLLITENWTDAATATEPYPVRVWSVALNVAARAVVNPRGSSSKTRAWDDVNVTERFEGDALSRLGLYLTDEEIATLNGTVDDAPPLGIGTIQTPTRDRVPTTRAWDAQC